MIYSMTGFGRSQFTFKDKNFTIELRSLNSKNIDINLRLPSYYKAEDINIRKAISQDLLRGKVDLYLNIENQEGAKTYSINSEIVQSYMKELNTIESNISPAELLQISMKLPDVLNNENESEISEEEVMAFGNALNEAMSQLIEFRKNEGKSLEEDLLLQVNNIDDYLRQVEPYIKERNEKVEAKLKKALKDIEVNYDEQRFHQELMFYLEKLDVSEEQVRLKQHLEYFVESLESSENQKGKLLGFISQEMGREINTLGSKANQSDIQKLVVQMKDSLERIKEQVLNVL